MDPEAKRHKFQSYASTLKSTHVPVLPTIEAPGSIPDTSSSFHVAIIDWREVNLSPSFTLFADEVERLSSSMHLLLHHWKQIAEAWLRAIERAEVDAFDPLLDLLGKMVHDLRLTLLPLYEPLLSRLLGLVNRKLPPSALQVLHTTLASLLKYILLPTPTLLVPTWESVASVLRIGGESARFLAESWGRTLRRMAANDRERVLGAMVEEQDVDFTVAVALVEALKSPNHGHPPSAPVILRVLLRHLGSSAASTLPTTLKRVLTALLHHTTAPNFAPLMDALLDSQAEISPDGMNLYLSVLRVPFAVRRGGRILESHIKRILPHLSALPPFKEVLHLCTSTLSAGSLPVWAGEGKKMLDAIWRRDDKSFAVQLSQALCESEWKGYNSFIVPYLIYYSEPLFASHGRELLRLLSEMSRREILQDVRQSTGGKGFLDSLGAWITTQLQSISQWGEEEVCDLYNILTILPFLSSPPDLLPIIQQLAASSSTQEQWRRTPANHAWALAACLAYTSNSVHSMRLLALLPTLLEKWGWNAQVISALSSVTQAVLDTADAQGSLDKSALQPLLLSASSPKRLAALQILSSPFVHCSMDEKSVYKQCLEAEEVTLSVDRIRERVLKTERVTSPEGVTWLAAQLKLNLRPLWASASQAIAKVAERHPDEVWRCLLSELEAACLAPDTLKEPQTAWTLSTTTEVEVEEERTFRDPSLARMDGLIDQVASIGVGRELDALVEIQRTKDRLDVPNYEIQLLKTMALFPNLAERNNRALVALLLRFCGDDNGEVSSIRPIPRRLRTRLASWLTLFSRFVNSQALYRWSTLQNLYLSSLSTPERSLQRLSLDCLLAESSSPLRSYGDRFKALLDDTKFRDELSSMDLSQIEEGHRANIVPALIRLLYGVLTSRTTKVRARRRAILSSLAGCSPEELKTLVKLMLEPFGDIVSEEPQHAFAFHDAAPQASGKQQVGFLRLLGDVLSQMGTALLPSWSVLLRATLTLLHSAQRSVSLLAAPAQEDVPLADEASDADGEPLENEPAHVPHHTIRQLGLKRLSDFFRSTAPFDFSPYMSLAFASFISPRIPYLDSENTQAPSALLELFHTWSSRRETVRYLVEYDGRLIPKLLDCLTAVSVKAAVVSYVLDMIDHLLIQTSLDDSLADTLIKPYVNILFVKLADGVVDGSGKAVFNDLLKRQIALVSRLAPYVTEDTDAGRILAVFRPLLRKPAKLVPERVKSDLLHIYSALFPLSPQLEDADSAEFSDLYGLLCSLFLSLSERQARLSLVAAFQQLILPHDAYQLIAELIVSLNAYSTRRPEELDFDRRLAAFNTINETHYQSFNVQSWLPLLYNTLHFVQEPEELAIRSNASYTLRRFIEVVVAKKSAEFEGLFVRVLYPGLRQGLRAKSELVRAEAVSVIGFAAEKGDFTLALREMKVLLADGDDEANVFNNLYHIQNHRRTRALRRLADQCDAGLLGSSLLNEVFVPLVGRFITDAAIIDHQIVNEAINTMGRLSRRITWSSYNKVVRYWLRLARQKTPLERTFIRTVISILENFSFTLEEEVTVDAHPPGELEAALHDEEEEETPEQHILPVINVEHGPTTTGSLRIHDAVIGRLLPELLSYLEQRGETDDSIRIPIAYGIVCITQKLPESSQRAQMSRLLTTLCQVFRSRSHDTRLLARETLCKIAVRLGQEHFPLIIHELRMALLRGPQLHVLAFVTHALLAHVTQPGQAALFSNLDEAASDIAHISSEVIFGESGKDVRSEEFRTTFKEVRSSASKALDAFQIISRLVSASRVRAILVPIRQILGSTDTLRTLQLVDDVLRRIASGLNGNAHLSAGDVLLLCHSLISQNSAFFQESSYDRKKRSAKSSDYIVQTKRDVVKPTNNMPSNAHKFVSFGLDLFITAFRRGRFDFKDEDIVARMEPLVPVIGETLYSNDASVAVAGAKASAAIAKCPLGAVDKALPVFIRRLLNLIRTSGSLDAEVAQAAVKSLAIILRDCGKAEIAESDLRYLLEIITPDLEEPTRQSLSFNLLRAIISRQFIVPEIYDLMSRVSDIMVTNQSVQVQELCRSVMLQFLLDYPQGKGRLRHQMTFIATNLSYVHESGRRSVMELLSAVIEKFQAELVREYSDILFAALVMNLANDESARCREMATELVKKLVARLNINAQQVLFSRLHLWMAQIEDQQLICVATQVYCLLVDQLQQGVQPQLPTVLGYVTAVVSRTASQFKGLEDVDNNSEPMDVDIDWQLPYHALSLMTKLLHIFPTLLQSYTFPLHAILSLFLFPHAWVRLAAARAAGMLMTSSNAAKIGPAEVDQQEVSFEMLVQVARLSALQLRSPKLDMDLSVQVVRNLLFVGRCFSRVTPTIKPALDLGGDDTESESEENEEEAADRNVTENPLAWLFTKLSYQMRRSHAERRKRSAAYSPSRKWSVEPLAILRWFAAMAAHLDKDALEPFLPHILSPIYRLLDDDMTKDDDMAELKALCQELQDMLQQKIGTTTFSNTYNVIRQRVLEVRRERKTTRVIQANTDPEAAARFKMKRNAMKVQNRKRKSSMHVASNGRDGGMKRRRL